MNKNMSFSVSGQRIELTDAAMLVAGTVNEYTARFTFDESWDGYQRTAVFSCGDISREQLLTDDACTVPWEVLISNGYLRVGVYGTKDGSRLPTIWTERRLYINPGAGPTQEAEDPSPTLVEQLLGRMGDLAALKTQDKSSLVAAINEVWSSGGSGGGGSGVGPYKFIQTVTIPDGEEVSIVEITIPAKTRKLYVLGSTNTTSIFGTTVRTQIKNGNVVLAAINIDKNMSHRNALFSAELYDGIQFMSFSSANINGGFDGLYPGNTSFNDYASYFSKENNFLQIIIKSGSSTNQYFAAGCTFDLYAACEE